MYVITYCKPEAVRQGEIILNNKPCNIIYIIYKILVKVLFNKFKRKKHKTAEKQIYKTNIKKYIPESKHGCGLAHSWGENLQ